MRKISILAVMLSLFTATADAAVPKNLTLVSLDGEKLAAKQFEGKAILFVNVASQCGYTSQYKGLQALYEQHKDKGLVVIGVPCNQFGGQEPGSAAEIQTFCQKNYGVTFPLLVKQDVNGGERSKLYQELISSEVGGGEDVRWNFEKFLVDRDGNVVRRFRSSVDPDDEELKKAITLVLEK